MGQLRFVTLTGSIFAFGMTWTGEPLLTMSHSVTHLLSELFPDIGHPEYQRVLEIIGFVCVVAALIGTLAAAVIFLIVDAL